MANYYHILIGMAGLMLLSGCMGMPSTTTESPRVYALEAEFERAGHVKAIPLTLLVSTPRAAAGLESTGMAYIRQPFLTEYFTNSRWIEPPAKMLMLPLVSALEASAGFRSVVPASGMVKGDMRLDVEITKLRQEFTSTPSKMRIILRAQLVDLHSFRVLATQTFEAYENAPSDSPYGGVVATNRALKQLLRQIANFTHYHASAGGASELLK